MSVEKLLVFWEGSERLSEDSFSSGQFAMYKIKPYKNTTDNKVK